MEFLQKPRYKVFLQTNASLLAAKYMFKLNNKIIIQL